MQVSRLGFNGKKALVEWRSFFDLSHNWIRLCRGRQVLFLSNYIHVYAQTKPERDDCRDYTKPMN